MTGTPILILKEGTKRDKGKGAQSNNIAAAKAIADAVRTTLGPRGMDKMLVDSLGDVVITNDGATILKEIDIDHPAAKMIVEISKTQDDECGDGTTTAVVIAGELLKKAEELTNMNVHATIIANGFRVAADEATRALSKMSIKVSHDDDKVLRDIAKTAMTGKNIDSTEHLAKIAVKAVTAISEGSHGIRTADVDNIKVEKKYGGAISDTLLVTGIIVDKERDHPRMPTQVKNAKVALVNTAFEVKKTEVSAEIRIEDAQQLKRFINEEESMLKNMVESVKTSGANVVFSQKGIDDLAQHYLAKEGIYSVKRVKESDLKKLAKATGGKIVNSLTELSKNELGYAKLVEQKKVGTNEMTFVTGCRNPKAVSILVRGGTEHVVDEVERSLHDALKVVSVTIEDGKAVAGGGASEIELALHLKRFAATIGGREQLAIEAFAEAMEVIPRALAENAGLDGINTIIDLKKAHGGKAKNKNCGIDVFTGKVSDMTKLKILEPLRVKIQAIGSATDVATMILRIDDVIAAKHTEMPAGGMGGPGCGMGGMGGMPPMM
ncbi:MAG: TCP-1/cpn60 chaperonin family protein [Methanomassiliicoccales archaeon]|nr:MAG: TCP-1/cpn60 chaperonin family protein [Methanomassiliicoccales archaeon]